MQTLFAILFAFATVLSPWVCCCAPARMLATAPVAEQDDDEACSCCKCETKKQQTPKPEEPCPCKMPPLPEMVAIDGKAIITSAVDASPQMTIYIVPLEYVAIDSTAAAVVASKLPFLPPKTRLHAHHVMHC